MKRLGIALAATALVLAGCGSDTEAPPPGTGAIGSTSDINPHPVEDLKDGGNLRLSLFEMPPNWNTNQIDGNGAETATIVRTMMPRAFWTDAAGKTTVNTDYFTSVELTNTNPQQVTYTINPKAVWSDGSPITWEDIAAQANVLSGKDKAFLVAGTTGFDRVEKVERGSDDRQAIITFNQHYADWRGQFAGNQMLLPKQVHADPDVFNKGWLDGPGLTAGPFMIGSIDKAQNRITLVRNPKWWGATPKLDTITFSVLADAAEVPALINNEIDAIPLGSLADLTQVQTNPDLVIRRAPSNGWNHITFNGASELLSDVRVRLAISKAVDRQGIANAVLNGLVENPKPMNNHVFLAGQEGYQDNSVKFDPEQARKDLDDAGWKLVGDVREKDGRKFEIRYTTSQAVVTQQVAQIVQQNLAAVGIKLNIVIAPSQGLFDEVFRPGNFDLGNWAWIGDPFPYTSLNQIWGYNPDDLQGNYGRIGSPELNDLIERTVSELDPQKAIELANEVDKAIWAEGHSLPTTQGAGNVGVRKNLANYGAKGLADIDITKVGFLK